MVLTLGLFQLENLTLSRAPFLLLDLRMMPQLLPSPRVQACIQHAEVVRESDLQSFLKRREVGAHTPVILMCEDGRISYNAAQRLSGKGFSQLYVVEGGTDGLLRETDDLPFSGSTK